MQHPSEMYHLSFIFGGEVQGIRIAMHDIVLLDVLWIKAMCNGGSNECVFESTTTKPCICVILTRNSTYLFQPNEQLLKIKEWNSQCRVHNIFSFLTDSNTWTATIKLQTYLQIGISYHDNIMTWKSSLHYWPFVRGIHTQSGDNRFEIPWHTCEITAIYTWIEFGALMINDNFN